MLKKLFSLLAIAGALLLPVATWAAHPLVTDDAATQGQGKFQYELNGQYDTNKNLGITTTGETFNNVLTYGVFNNTDVIIGVPYQFVHTKTVGSTKSYDGFNDSYIDVKYRFYEHNGLSFALRPGISVPTGNDSKGLGNDRVGYRAYLIGTQDFGTFLVSGNVGYTRNDSNNPNTELNLWHVSVSGTMLLTDQWKVVADVAADRNTDSHDYNNPVSVLTGIIYSPTSNIDIDLGVKRGLTTTATDWSVLAGTTFRF